MQAFDPARLAKRLDWGHGGRLGIGYHAHGPDWIELELPFSPDHLGDADRGLIASGPVATLMDQAVSLAIWMRRGRFAPHVTLDLRIDHLRSPAPGVALIGRGVCARLAGPLAFVSGETHDGDAADPVARIAGTFMLVEPA